MATTHSTPLLSPMVKVNVALCGSIPRTKMESLSLAKFASSHCVVQPNSYLQSRPQQLSSSETVASQLSLQLCNMQNQSLSQSDADCTRRASPPTFEAPSWAVPAAGESRLEPVCDSIERQAPVDLRNQAVFRIGRAPQSDIQLNHLTSSRRHAMLFHHSNGSCYIVDCGSAHGTYVNGTRITSPPNGGVVVPHKVRRGAMIRFGGPGAPEFMLKSFNFELDEMRDFSVASSAAPMSPSEAASSSMVEHNTRLNSLGKSAKDCLLFSNLTSKRSFDSMDTAVSDTDVEMRCSSPLLSPEQQPPRLVSPDNTGVLGGQPQKRRRVSFSSEPPRAFYPNLISPDLSSDETE